MLLFFVGRYESLIEQNHRINKKELEEVDQYASYHDEKTLPCRFCSELIRLYRLFHLFCVERLVYHTGYLTITT